MTYNKLSSDYSFGCEINVREEKKNAWVRARKVK